MRYQPQRDHAALDVVVDELGHDRRHLGRRRLFLAKSIKRGLGVERRRPDSIESDGCLISSPAHCIRQS